jgi:hypothetical protein
MYTLQEESFLIQRIVLKAKTLLETFHVKLFLGTLNSHLEAFGQIHTVFGGILTKHKNLQPVVIPFFKMHHVFFFSHDPCQMPALYHRKKKRHSKKSLICILCNTLGHMHYRNKGPHKASGTIYT